MTEERVFQAGVASADITPAVGIQLVGFAGRGPSIGIHDHLHARALAFRDGSSRAVLIACDLLGLDAAAVADVRRAVTERVDIPSDRITVSCTHTHYGPDAYRDTSSPEVAAYRSNLVYQLSGAVFEAFQNMRPARIGVGWGSSSIGINRREKLPDGSIILGQNPNGPIDRELGVVRVDGLDGQPIAVVANFATHPVSQGGRMRLISADYPGRACSLVTELTGVPCLFLQGACGNINSIIMEHSHEPPRTLGTRLGCEIVRVWETIASEPVSSLSVASRMVSLPRLNFGSEAAAESVVKSLREEVETLRAAEEPNEGRIYWAETRLRRAEEALAGWRGEPLPAIEVEIQALRVDDFAYVTAPAEVFNQTGSTVKKRSPFAHTFFVGYTNGSIGYIPVPEAYPEGGYEVSHGSQVNPDAEGILADGCVELLNDLKEQ